MVLGEASRCCNCHNCNADVMPVIHKNPKRVAWFVGMMSTDSQCRTPMPRTAMAWFALDLFTRMGCVSPYKDFCESLALLMLLMID